MLLDNVGYQNQWAEYLTRNFCVYYSSAHWSNEENFQEWSVTRVKGKDLWLKAIELDRLDPEVWAYVKDGPKTLKDEWYIKWWALCKTVDEVKQSIYNKRPLVTGSNKINWWTANKAPYVLKGNTWPWHAIAIIWYDDDYEGWCLIIKNSYWDEKFDGGKMYLPYKSFDLLFNSKYSLIDKEDAILSYKKKVMEWINIESAKRAFEEGLWNGERPTDSMTREETAAIIMRAIDKLRGE